MANSTHTLISAQTLNASTASVNFNSIPQTYTDLLFKASVRSDAISSNTGYYDVFLLRFNGTTTTYNAIDVFEQNSVTGSTFETTATSTNATGTWARFNSVGINDSNASATVSLFTPVEIYIPNYTSANNKAYSAETAEEQNAAATTTAFSAGLWTSTAAITSVSFALKDGSFSQYSTFYLYGIKNS